MVAVITKFHGPTNTRGSRVSADRADGGSRVYVSWDHALNSDQNHRAAAEACIRKWDWSGLWVGGHTDTGMVFVQVEYRETLEVRA